MRRDPGPASAVLGAPDLAGNPNGEDQLSLFKNAEKGGGALIPANGKSNGVHKGSRELNGHEMHDAPKSSAVRVNSDRVISLKRLWEEVDSKRARTLLSGAFFRYLLFVIIYLAALHYQKSAEPSYYTTSGIEDLYVRATYVDPSTQAHVTYHDIASVGDFWLWIENKFLPVTFNMAYSNGDAKPDYYKAALLGGNRILKGFRITQRRSESGNCLLTERYNSFFPYCFPNTWDEGRSGRTHKEPFGPYYNDTKYRYTNFMHAGGREDSGYVVNIEYDRTVASRTVQELKSDRFLTEATRWVRVDFATYNPSSNLFAHVEFILDMDITGRVMPRTRITTMRTDMYLETVRDYVQIVLELLVIIGVIMFAMGDIKDCLILRSRHGGIGQYWNNFWNWVDFLLVLLFALDFTMWILLLTDTTRDDINIALGPSQVGAGADQRLVLRDTMDLHGQSVNLWSIRVKNDIYWAAQSCTLLIVLARLLKYLAVNSFLGTLVESFVVMKTALLQYLIMVVASNIAFAYMGYCLFGHGMKEFHTIDSSFFTLLATTLGDGITYEELV